MGLTSPLLDHDPVVYILTLGTLEAARGQGIASALIRACCQQAAANRCEGRGCSDGFTGRGKGECRLLTAVSEETRLRCPDTSHDTAVHTVCWVSGMPQEAPTSRTPILRPLPSC